MEEKMNVLLDVSACRVASCMRNIKAWRRLAAELPDGDEKKEYAQWLSAETDKIYLVVGLIADAGLYREFKTALNQKVELPKDVIYSDRTTALTSYVKYGSL